MEGHSNVIFGGDGYSAEWHRMAVEDRGLKNLPTSADALPAFREESVVKLFSSSGVLTPVELASRFEVYSEQYLLSIEVEAKLVVDMATTMIYPAAVEYLSQIATTASSMAALNISLDSGVAAAVAGEANAMMAAVRTLSAALEVHDFDSTEAHMQYAASTLRSLMVEVRGHADTLETLVADDLWPLPKYAEMLFIK